MQQRERLLAKITGAAVVIAGVQFGYTFIQGAFEERQMRIAALEQQLQDSQSALVRGKRAKKRIEEWNKRSLPSNLDHARSLYQNWLANMVEDLQLGKAEVSSGPAIPRLGIYNRLPFTVRGQGSLSQITQLLYEFYRADHLHQVQRLSLVPLAAADGGGAFASVGGPSPGSNGGPGGPAGARSMFFGRGMFGFPGMQGMGQMTQFDVTMSIEALVLPGADRADQLNSGTSDRLAFKNLDDYRQPITRRNIFSPYVERPQEADDSRDAYITAVMKVDGRLQAWLSLRNLGIVKKLREGDRIDVGSVHARVASIHDQAIEIEIDGKRRKITLGSSLSESQERPDDKSSSEGTPKPQSPTQQPAAETAATEPADASAPAKTAPAQDVPGDSNAR